jgi:hypothetical protein
MKKLSCAALVAMALVFVVYPASAETVRLDVVAGVELLNRPSYGEVLKAFDNQANIIPGVSWEVMGRNFGVGMTGLVKFDRLDPAVSSLGYDWYLDWIGSWDFRYHILPRFLLDPFVEAGVGSAGRVHISGAGRDPLNLSLFGQVGGGLAIRLLGAHVGVKVLYRFLNDPIPATSFEVYPLKSFQVDLFAGVSL